jgi:hypothetical protein
MQIPVLLEQISGNGYRAKTGEPFSLSADGSTSEEALQKVRTLVEEKLRGGAKVVQLEIPSDVNPWLRIAGTLDPNDPMVQEWKEIMMENRRKADEDPDYL